MAQRLEDDRGAAGDCVQAEDLDGNADKELAAAASGCDVERLRLSCLGRDAARRWRRSSAGCSCTPKLDALATIKRAIEDRRGSGQALADALAEDRGGARSPDDPRTRPTSNGRRWFDAQVYLKTSDIGAKAEMLDGSGLYMLVRTELAGRDPRFAVQTRSTASDEALGHQARGEPARRASTGG